MPTYKNIRVPVGKSGKTRLQRVQVLASGKYKFVKNLAKPATTKSRSRSRTRSVRNTSGRGKIFRNLSGAGALEDVAWGYVGFNAFGRGPEALPLTRAVQGIAGYAMNRRGKARALPAILDLISLWLAGGWTGAMTFPKLDLKAWQ